MTIYKNRHPQIVMAAKKWLYVLPKIMAVKQYVCRFQNKKKPCHSRVRVQPHFQCVAEENIGGATFRNLPMFMTIYKKRHPQIVMAATSWL